jgi:hypothetical protein
MSSTQNDAKEFEIAMQEMAADPQIRAECEAIAREFAPCESDGLPAD